jgi:hypothetical protein
MSVEISDFAATFAIASKTSAAPMRSSVATAAAALMVKSPWKTATRRKMICSVSGSSS